MSKEFIVLLFFALFLSSNFLSSNVSSDAQSNADELEQKILQLDRVSYHPSLLPLVMQNIDYLELTPEQQIRLKNWRKDHAPEMLEKMREVALARVDFVETSLKPKSSKEELMKRQQQLFRLQEEVLRYKLACRQNILDIFTQEQWDAMLFILADRQAEN